MSTTTITKALRATLPKTWRPTPPAQRSTLLATCGRCHQLARLPLGGLVDDDACDDCRLDAVRAIVGGGE